MCSKVIVNYFTHLCFKFLLQLNVAAIFILVAIDEGPGGSNIKYQPNEINKLHSVISILVRCCDCTEKCVSSAPVSLQIIYVSYCFCIS
jgi:ubiquitin carboxyl-terminal hydrolase 9/24